MQASSKKSDVAQPLDSSASERAAVVFAFTCFAVVEAHLAEAARMAIMREARALFWQCMRAMRDADKAWGL
jgi:hypothetical protein